MTVLERFRRDKDQYLETDPDSPLYGTPFFGLSYYAESESYTVTAAFRRAEDRKAVLLGTSGDEQPYFLAGYADFELNAQPCTLTLYQPTFEPGDSTRFFVPFKDAMSGAETYGAGRYLEAPLLSGGQILLDFNRAYHPFCAYSERYRCPLPPAENILSVPIYAGEKL